MRRYLTLILVLIISIMVLLPTEANSQEMNSASAMVEEHCEEKSCTVEKQQSLFVSDNMSSNTLGLSKKDNPYQCNEEKISQFVQLYFNNRNDFLKNNNSNALDSIAVGGIIRDEQKHREIITCHTIQVMIQNIDVFDFYATIDVQEYLDNETIVLHDIIVDNSNDQLLVVSDSYFDYSSGFSSASYISEEMVGELERIKTEQNNIPKSLCKAKQLINIATNEIGYTEKDYEAYIYYKTEYAGTSDYNKYGKWYDLNVYNGSFVSLPWCACFVSWCANHAGISNSIFPPFATNLTGIYAFINMNRFYYSPNYDPSSTYVPAVGDIFFCGYDMVNYTNKHTGIVTAVSSTGFSTIEGNVSNKVVTRYFSFTDTWLLGYFKPNYSHYLTSYQSNNAYHWKTCTSCGAVVDKSAHTYIAIGGGYQCSVCGRILSLELFDFEKMRTYEEQ